MQPFECGKYDEIESMTKKSLASPKEIQIPEDLHYTFN